MSIPPCISPLSRAILVISEDLFMKKIAVLLLLLAGILTACNTPNNNVQQNQYHPDHTKKGQYKEQYNINFSVSGVGGSITAKIDGTDIIYTTSPIAVENGKIVIFTAIPDANYEIDSWSIPTTDNSKKTATLIATKNTGVYVTFKEIDPIAKENKNVVSEKKHVEKDAWVVAMSGSKDNFTSKISNSVAFLSLKVENKMFPSFIILKNINQSGEIKFLISAAITSNEYKTPSIGKDIQIKLIDNSIMEFDCVPDFRITDNGFHRTTLFTNISLKEINKLRMQNTDIAVRIKFDGGTLDFTLPPLFFEYLRQI